MPAPVPASTSPWSTPRRGVATGLVLLLTASLLSLVALAGPAEARRTPTPAQAAAAAHAAGAHRAGVKRAAAKRAAQHRAAVHRAAVHRAAVHRAAVKRAAAKRAHRHQAHKSHKALSPAAKARRARYLGIPKYRYAVPPATYFSFPNRSEAESLTIRNRVLATVRSTWGARRNSLGLPLPTGGTIRMASWSFDDWPMARALVAAKNRGVSVQVLAAADANGDHGPWAYLRANLGGNLYRPGHPETREVASFARQCRGSCRGAGGTPHAKYFLFSNVGARHLRNVTIQTSMNLTSFAYQNQWNHAQVMWSAPIYRDFLSVFRQARLGRTVRSPYHVFASGNVVNFFFPGATAKAATDPVMQILDKVSCTGAATGNGRTRIRVMQYAIYGQRGTWIAKRLRALWDRGCDVAIIYSLSSLPVMSVLRSNTGRGPIPMRQSVIKDPYGVILKYNHSKWMTITGHWGSSRAIALTFAGSANWANLAMASDEQMQRIIGLPVTAGYNAAFAKTWAQKSSTLPTFGRIVPGGRVMLFARDVPEVAPAFGHGIYRHMSQD